MEENGKRKKGNEERKAREKPKVDFVPREKRPIDGIVSAVPEQSQYFNSLNLVISHDCLCEPECM